MRAEAQGVLLKRREDLAINTSEALSQGNWTIILTHMMDGRCYHNIRLFARSRHIVVKKLSNNLLTARDDRRTIHRFQLLHVVID